jgi:hypothetical protein
MREMCDSLVCDEVFDDLFTDESSDKEPVPQDSFDSEDPDYLNFEDFKRFDAFVEALKVKDAIETAAKAFKHINNVPPPTNAAEEHEARVMVQNTLRIAERARNMLMAFGK